MSIDSAQDLGRLTTQLRALAEEIKDGMSSDAITHKLRMALETLSAMATHDELTGALNRRGLLQKLDAELERAKRTGHPFSFALIAIDNFVSINQQHGSAVGDRILQSLTQTALKLFRSLDAFGRTGDSEFAIMLPTTWLDQSEKPFSRLASSIAALDWRDVAPRLMVTFSTGITTNAPGDTANALILRAAEALVMAQEQGGGAIAQLEANLPVFDPDLP